MPRSAEQFEQLRNEKKKLIRETALGLFAENGFHATSISQIAQKAKISKGLAYNYFESKFDILKDIIYNGFDEFFGGFDVNQDNRVTDEEYYAFIRKSFALVKQNPRYWKLYYSLMLQPVVTDSLSNEFIDRSKPVMAMMYNFIVTKGSQDPEGDLMAIGSMLEGAMLYAVVTPDIFPIDQLVEKIISTIQRIIETNTNKQL